MDILIKELKFSEIKFQEGIEDSLNNGSNKIFKEDQLNYVKGFMELKM